VHRREICRKEGRQATRARTRRAWFAEPRILAARPQFLAAFTDGFLALIDPPWRRGRGMLGAWRRRELFATAEVNPAPPGKPSGKDK